MRVLIVDDDDNSRSELNLTLRMLGHEVVERSNGVDALAIPEEDLKRIDAAVLDFVMPELNGIETGRRLRERYPRIYLVMLTAYASVQHAVQAIRDGSFSDYLEKPVEKESLELTLLRAKSLIEERLAASRGQILKTYKSTQMIGEAPSYIEAFTIARKAAGADSTVLITGESGTGKELIARYIHENSRRGRLPFIDVNCAALPSELIESELFGHEKGAFTGATAKREGLFELADKGTLFLDEVGDLSLSVQSKLLRILQEREVRRLGGNRNIPIDVRIISATNRDLDAMAKGGDFRPELLQRLKVLEVHLPPLRERREDIPALANHFFNLYSKDYPKLQGISADAMEALHRYKWEGNIRELRNAIERAVAFAEGNYLSTADLPPVIINPNLKRGSTSFFKQYNDGLDVERLKIDYIESLFKQGVNSKDIGKEFYPTADHPTQAFASFWTNERIKEVFISTPMEDMKDRWKLVLLDLSSNRKKMMERENYPERLIDYKD